jgi:hypothetical protein
VVTRENGVSTPDAVTLRALGMTVPAGSMKP